MNPRPPLLPFKRILNYRPYSPTGMTTARWVAEIPVEPIKLRELWLTQDQVSVAALFDLQDSTRPSDLYPHVVSHDGELYLEDGHHCVLRAYFLFCTPVLFMRVLRRDAP